MAKIYRNPKKINIPEGDTVAEDGGQGDVLYGRMRARAVRQQREREQERLEREYGRVRWTCIED